MLLPIANINIPRYGNGRYGVRRSPSHVHQGLDLGAPEGTPVHAADDGTVERVVVAGTRGFSGYGVAIVIKHDRPAAVKNVWTLYAHLLPGSAVVNVGQKVKRGDVIARVGKSCGTVDDPGKKCGGAHLHFEVSQRPYPQPSESPRLDPTFFLSRT